MLHGDSRLCHRLMDLEEGGAVRLRYRLGWYVAAVDEGMFAAAVVS